MTMRNELILFLGFRFHEAGSATLRTLEALLEEIAALDSSGRIPLHWNTPLYPLFSGSSRGLTDLITEIKARVKTRGDVVAPAGFRGALHPFLDDHELDRELSWCRRNPWIGGFKDLFGQEPEVTIPFAPDLIREAASGVYSGAGYQLVGLPFRAAHGAGKQREHRRKKHARAAEGNLFLLYREPPRAAVAAVQVLSLDALVGDPGAPASLAAEASSPLFLLLDLPEQKRPDQAESSRPAVGSEKPVSRLIDALSHRRSLAAASLRGEALEAALSGRRLQEVAEAAGRHAFPLGAFLNASEACGRLESEAGLFGRRRQEEILPLRRPGRRRNEDTRRALDLLTPDWSPPGKPAPTPPSRPSTGGGRPGQILFAEMGGVVSLPGPGFVAHFADGRLRGISRQGTEVFVGLPAESSFQLAGRRYSLQTVSAASFERDLDHGLSTVFTTEIAAGAGEIRMLAEAFFREGKKELHLDLTVSFPPRAPALEAALPYEIPLFRLTDHQGAELATELENGDWHTEWIPPLEGCLLACGRRLRVSTGDAAVLLSEAPVQAKRETSVVMALPLRIRQESGAWVLRACLGGRTCPSPSLDVAGAESRLSYRIALQDA
jgi:hypothetical protein